MYNPCSLHDLHITYPLIIVIFVAVCIVLAYNDYVEMMQNGDGNYENVEKEETEEEKVVEVPVVVPKPTTNKRQKAASSRKSQ